MSSRSFTNPNPACYEALAPCYEAIYGQIDTRETVRQWQLLLTQLDLVPLTGNRLSLVDIGCGPGWHLEAWAEAGFRVAGVDASRTMLEQARTRLAAAGQSAELYLADVRQGREIPAGLNFDLAVSHFNLPNLFPPEEREALFRTAARLVRPGGYWILDFSEPFATPASIEETIHLPTDILERKGKFNGQLGRYDQLWKSSTLTCVEQFWFGHRAAAPSLALGTGWRLCLRKAWHPYAPPAIWKEPEAQDQVLVDVYVREGGGRGDGVDN